MLDLILIVVVVAYAVAIVYEVRRDNDAKRNKH